MKTTVTAEPDPDQVSVVDSNLSDFNEELYGPSKRSPLSVFVSDEDGHVIAGINGSTSWGWLYVQRLWVGEQARGQGLAAEMLAAAEQEAIKRDCHSAYIDTVNPVALKTYKRCGYREYGVLKNFVAGLDRTFLQKKL